MVIFSRPLGLLNLILQEKGVPNENISDCFYKTYIDKDTQQNTPPKKGGAPYDKDISHSLQIPSNTVEDGPRSGPQPAMRIRLKYRLFTAYKV